MKRIDKWFNRQDRLEIIMILVAVLILILNLQQDPIIQNIYSVLAIPIMLFILQIFLRQKFDNGEYNIDINLTNNIENEVIWRTENEGEIDNYSYLVINNIGEINVYSVYLKIENYRNIIGYYEIQENLRKNEKWYIRIPNKYEDIKEITVSCELPGECRTKRFWGLKSGNEEMTIFAKSERKNIEKEAVKNEKGFERAELMIRFKI